jgi:hypothetical protein
MPEGFLAKDLYLQEFLCGFWEKSLHFSRMKQGDLENCNVGRNKQKYNRDVAC